MAPERLIVFDYSGTLSLAAPRFARPENLVRALAGSGLAALGVATPELFWTQIVGPTWVAGSTTRAGYGKVMADRIATAGWAPGAGRDRIGAAVDRFVAAYLEGSPIDPLWRPLLQRLAGEGPSLQVVVATDHYAEATTAIIGHLQALGIAAVSLGEGESRAAASAAPRFGKAGAPPFGVANSADLGAWKADHRFWERLKRRLAGPPERGLLVLDDFGLNEGAGDAYGRSAAVAARQAATRAALEAVFTAPVEIFPFFLPGREDESEAAARRLIAAAADRIEGFLG